MRFPRSANTESTALGELKRSEKSEVNEFIFFLNSEIKNITQKSFSYHPYIFSVKIFSSSLYQTKLASSFALTIHCMIIKSPGSHLNSNVF